MIKVLFSVLVFASSAHAQLFCADAFMKDDATLPATEFNYELHGPADAPVVILLHGMNNGIATWKPTIGALAQDFRVLVIDQRGNGKTPALGDDYSAEAMARDVKALMTHLRIQRASLIGHSLGGRTALAFAKLFPESLDRVIVEDMSIGIAQDTKPEIVAKNRAYATAISHLPPLPLDAAAEQIKHLFKDDVEKAKRFLNRVSMGTDRTTGNVRLDRAPAAVLWGFQAMTEDYSAALAQFHGPKLLLAADSTLSPFVTDEGAAVAERAGMQVMRVAGANHSVHGSKPDEFNQIARAFLSARH